MSSTSGITHTPGIHPVHTPDTGPAATPHGPASPGSTHRPPSSTGLTARPRAISIGAAPPQAGGMAGRAAQVLRRPSLSVSAEGHALDAAARFTFRSPADQLAFTASECRTLADFSEHAAAIAKLPGDTRAKPLAAHAEHLAKAVAETETFFRNDESALLAGIRLNHLVNGQSDEHGTVLIHPMPATNGADPQMRQLMGSYLGLALALTRRGGLCDVPSAYTHAALLGGIIRQHKLLAQDGVMTEWLGRQIAPGNTAGEVGMACASMPMLVYRLEPKDFKPYIGNDVPPEQLQKHCTERATEMLTQVADAMLGEHGLAKLSAQRPPDGPSELEQQLPKLMAGFDLAIEKHGINLDQNPALKGAVDRLRNFQAPDAGARSGPGAA